MSLAPSIRNHTVLPATQHRQTLSRQASTIDLLTPKRRRAELTLMVGYMIYLSTHNHSLKQIPFDSDMTEVESIRPLSQLAMNFTASLAFSRLKSWLSRDFCGDDGSAFSLRSCSFMQFLYSSYVFLFSTFMHDSR